MELLLPQEKIELKRGRRSFRSVRVVRYIIVLLEDEDTSNLYEYCYSL